MTLRIPAASIAPDLRFGAARVLADPDGSVAARGVTIRAEGCLPPSPDIPRYLRYGDRDAVLAIDGVDRVIDLETWLAREIQAIADADVLDDLAAAVIALDSVDRCFRQSGLWQGNIYLAGTEALALVLKLIQGTGQPPAGREPGVVMRELAAMELAYLFPIAGKFRAGGYDGQVQYRINGWGRALAQRLTATPLGADRAATSQRTIARHLAGEHQRYAFFLDGLDIARQHYTGDQLGLARTLPIPVLA